MSKIKAGSLTVVQSEEGAAITIFDKDPDYEPHTTKVFRIEPLDALGLLKLLRVQEAKLKEAVIKERLERMEKSWP
jgi:hypothetical protein